jgi:hypothetical protein
MIDLFPQRIVIGLAFALSRLGALLLRSLMVMC